MKKTTSFFITLLLLIIANSVKSQGIVINEILTSNSTINRDEDGTYQDWVELYNNGPTTVNLDGYGLTDNVALPYKWIFPNVTINSGAYLLIWCSDKNRADVGSELHSNFKISSSGETIVLTNSTGTTIDFVPATAILQNISYGRVPNGTGNFALISTVTPGATNSAQGISEALNPPTFSKDSGFLTAGFNLTLSTTESGATILYTLDGSEPQLSNLGGTTYSYKNQYPEFPGQATGSFLTNSFKTLQYSSPIAIIDKSLQANKIASISTTYSFNPTYIPTSPIFKGTVVRAKVIKSGALDSKTATKTYFITPLGVNRYSLPVLALSTDENKLFDYTSGINVAGKAFDDWRIANPSGVSEFDEYNANYWRKGIENEKTANMSYFVNGAEVVNNEIGIRIHGGISRHYQSKGYNLYSRAEYGSNELNYKFFNDKTETKFTNLILRNSGGDFINTMFRDALNQRVIKSLNCITEAYQPTITFMNGEYWGILNLREKYDNDYFSRVFNIASNELDYLENQGLEIDASYGDNVDYQNMITYITNNSLTSDANFNYIKTRLDPENFSDYFISNIYMQNGDWPGTNIEFWRKRTTGYIPDAPYGHDGRWRWSIHDMDDTMGSYYDTSKNTLALALATNGPDYPNPAWSTLLLRKLLVNPTFKNDFINRFADLMNTTFLPARIQSLINEMDAGIASEIPEHIARWKAPENLDSRLFFLNEGRDFADQRPDYQRNHIRSQFGIASNINTTLNVSDPSHGYIKMNTIEIKTGTDGISSNPYPWTGVYFSNIPITLKAIANPGFVFSKWTGAVTSTNPEIIVTAASSFSVTAVFVAETNATSQPIYYWMMNSALANNIPLESINSTYKTGATNGVLQYQSCLVGYPFVSTDVANWRKASMERRNSPTEVNYIPEANSNLPFATSDMKGIQIKEPLQKDGLENTLSFNFSTQDQKNIKFSFAALNELTNATAIVFDYAINAGAPIWINSGYTSSTLPLTNAYQLYTIDFSGISSVNNNSDFKVRLRFIGTNMTADTGARITMNNIAVFGTQTNLAVTANKLHSFAIYPNPFSDVVNIVGINSSVATYKIYTIDGKIIKKGIIENSKMNLEELSKGMYLLELFSEGKIETKKILKK